jgi:hypothetical protein
MKEDDSGLLLALRAEQAQTRKRGRADPTPPFVGTKNQLRPLPQVPGIFSFMGGKYMNFLNKRKPPQEEQ